MVMWGPLRVETSWDLGPFAAVLDTPLLKQQNTKKLYGTKNNCVHAQLGQILDPKRYKRPKNPTSTSEEPRAKTGCWEQKQGTEHAPGSQQHLRGGQNEHLSCPSGPTPGHTSTLTPYKEQARHPPRPTSASEQAREPIVCSRSPLLQQEPQ